MQIHIHIHQHGPSKDVEVLHNIFSLTKSIHNKTTVIMEELQLHLDALNKIDAATTKAGEEVTRIGARITSLEDTIKNMGLTADQESQLLTHTQGIGDRAEQLANALTQMGKTPEDPVPVEPPVEGGGL